MISTETVKFIGILNMLAEKSKYGIRPLSTATAQNKKGILYDDKRSVKIDDDDPFSGTVYPLFKSASDGITAVVITEDNEAYVYIEFEHDDDFSIVVKDGTWYNV
ncbi:MAG: hypothetical protein PUC40_05615 [Lachnospiraceae bacterium]|nr:hypothetical protein [Lachnospiraceae bacterium]MDD6466382.1 hypothetical protein [Coprococcus sp.]